MNKTGNSFLLGNSTDYKKGNKNERTNKLLSERLCVIMRYLVTGDAQVTIAAIYGMSPAVVGRIFYETYLGIRLPNTE